MSKKKSNLSSVNPENIRVIKQEQFEKLQTHFRNTKADRNFLSILGSMLIWIFAIPILLVSFYILSVSILSYFELFGVLSQPSVWNEGVLIDYIIVPLQYSFQTLLNVFEIDASSLFAALEDLYSSKEFVWILTIIFSVISLVMTLFYGSIFIEMFSVTTGKAKNRSKSIWSNIFFTAPSLIFVTFLLFGMASNQTFLFSNFDSSVLTIDDFKKWMEYSAILAAAVMVIPSFILLIGKYKTSIYLQIHS